MSDLMSKDHYIKTLLKYSPAWWHEFFRLMCQDDEHQQPFLRTSTTMSGAKVLAERETGMKMNMDKNQNDDDMVVVGIDLLRWWQTGKNLLAGKTSDFDVQKVCVDISNENAQRALMVVCMEAWWMHFGHKMGNGMSEENSRIWQDRQAFARHGASEVLVMWTGDVPHECMDVVHPVTGKRLTAFQRLHSVVNPSGDFSSCYTTLYCTSTLGLTPDLFKESHSPELDDEPSQGPKNASKSDNPQEGIEALEARCRHHGFVPRVPEALCGSTGEPTIVPSAVVGPRSTAQSSKRSVADRPRSAAPPPKMLKPDTVLAPINLGDLNVDDDAAVTSNPHPMAPMQPNRPPPPANLAKPMHDILSFLAKSTEQQEDQMEKMQMEGAPSLNICKRVHSLETQFQADEVDLEQRIQDDRVRLSLLREIDRTLSTKAEEELYSEALINKKKQQSELLIQHGQALMQLGLHETFYESMERLPNSTLTSRALNAAEANCRSQGSQPRGLIRESTTSRSQGSQPRFVDYNLLMQKAGFIIVARRDKDKEPGRKPGIADVTELTASLEEFLPNHDWAKWWMELGNFEASFTMHIQRQVCVQTSAYHSIAQWDRIHTYVRTYTYIRTYTYVYVYIYIRIYIYIYTYVYVYRGMEWG